MKTYILAKIYLYYVNAYTDAYLSRRLIKYVKGEIKYGDLEERIKTLVGDDRERTNEELIGLSYTNYFWNGFYDYMYARAFEKYFGWNFSKDLGEIKKIVEEYKKELKMEYAYIEFENRKIILLTPLLQMLKKKLYLFEYFVKRNELKDYINTPRKLIVSSMIHVQRANISSNVFISNDLKESQEGEDIKTKYILKASKQFDDPQRFISHVSKNLMYASRWDMWFTKLLVLLWGK